MIDYVAPGSGAALQDEGEYLVSRCGERFPVVREIPRFVTSESYAAAFGLEWNIHTRTQLDSHTGSGISRKRLERCLGGPAGQFAGKNVLEAGCGAGRFTELLVAAGAHVHSMDLSSAVEANLRNIGRQPNYRVCQADLRYPPYAPASFDLVLCLGVLQHTPSPEASISALWKMVVPGGWLVIDHYTWQLSLCSKLTPLYRQLLKRLSPTFAKKITDTAVRLFFPVHWHVRRIRPAQALLSRISPCLVYYGAYPDLTKEQHYEFCRLDTFDTLTDQYKRLRTRRQLRRTLEALGATEVSATYGGNGVEARCRKQRGEVAHAAPNIELQASCK